MRMSHEAEIDAYIAANLDKYLEEVMLLVRQPSITATGEGIAECADLTAGLLGRYGLDARLIPLAGGSPLVYAETAGESDRTMLFYNHYDVQPPEPLELWDSPPFAPMMRDGNLFGRGIEDDKAHIVSRLAAIDAVRAVHGAMPCRVKFVIEGEEEEGSPNLPGFIATHSDLLRADACIWESGAVNDANQPVLYLGMRGIAYVEFTVRTISHDAHSGTGGSILPNAAWRLTWLLSLLKGPDGRVRIPGFYDNIRPPSARDLEMLAGLPDEEAVMRERYGIRSFLNGLSGMDLRRESVFSPTCTICGLTAGYQGPGSKTVLPAEASAKVDFRLVPDQDPEDIYAKVRRFLDDNGFSDVETKFYSSERPAKVNPDDPFVKLAAETAQEVYGVAPALEPMIGGSGPMHPFVEVLGVPVATPGVGYPESRAHAPNENIRIADFLRGTRHMARLLDRWA